MRRFIDISYCDDIFIYSNKTNKIERGESLVNVRNLADKYSFFYITCCAPSNKNKPATVSFVMNRKSVYKSCGKLSSGIIVASDENALSNYIIENK